MAATATQMKQIIHSTICSSLCVCSREMIDTSLTGQVSGLVENPLIGILLDIKDVITLHIGTNHSALSILLVHTCLQ